MADPQGAPGIPQDPPPLPPSPKQPNVPLIDRRRLGTITVGGALGAIALALLQNLGTCSHNPDLPTVSVQNIIDYCKANCGFNTNVASVISVILTVVANFEPRLGPNAPVDAGVAKTIENMICAAVKVHQAQAKAMKGPKALEAPSSRVVIVVNGEKMEGQWVVKKTVYRPMGEKIEQPCLCPAQ